MKSALIPAGLCLIMLLGFSWIMDSALADNDVTSTGSTTNDQVNSTGSNTAITGGYNSESTTTYSSGSSSNATSLGMTKRDLNCERLKLAKALHDMGMKVASIALMCQDSRVFSAMAMSGTSCPYLGSIGAEAQSKWEKYGKLRPDYEEYVKTLRITQQIDNEILEDIDEKFILDSNGNPTNINN